MAGFLLAGSIESLPGLSGLFLVRTDYRGDTIWTKVVADSGAERRVLAATGDGAGGMVLVGRARLQRADWDAWAARVDSSGEVIWSQTWGASGWDDCALGVCRTWDAGWAVCGYTLQRRQPDVSVSRFAADGTRLWSVLAGTVRADYAHAITATSDSLLFVAGTTVPAGSRYSDIYLLSLDYLGSVRWSQVFGDSLWDEARAVAVMPDGGLAVAGFSSSYSPGMDCCVLRLDSSGQTVWQRALGREGQGERAYGLAVTSAGSLILVGESEPVAGAGADVYVARLDPLGSVVWERFCGRAGYDCATAVIVLDDGGLAVVGLTETSNLDGANFYFIRCDSMGSVGVKTADPRELGNHGAARPTFARGSVVIGVPAARVFGPDGRILRTLGRNDLEWNGRDASGRPAGAGMYYVLTPDGQIRKSVVLR